jgi:hypothetical protein
MKKYLVIIPSWSKLSLEMQVETGCDYPAFMQLGGTPLYAHILHNYEEIRNETKFIIVLPEKSPPLASNLLAGYDVSILRLHQSKSIGYTIFHSINDVKPGQSVIIHMADTLISPFEFINNSNVLFVQVRNDLYRWTSFRKEANGVLRVKSDRDSSNLQGESLVFVGVIALSEGFKFKGYLESELANPNVEIDTLFAAIEKYSEEFDIDLSIPEIWHDCGHVDSYYETRLQYQNLRHFNSLSYNAEHGLVTKRSQNLESFRNQVRWFKQVPDELHSFLPRIYESSDGPSPFITMELLSIPTLSEIFVGRRLELGAWNEVARKIFRIHSMFSKYSFSSSSAAQIAYSIYIEKTRIRILEFCKQRPELASVWVDFEGRRISIEVVLETLEMYASDANLLSIDKLTPIHGDMCFSNILYDPRGRQIKLIDPRGEFGVPGIYGDPRYDIAKMMHSYSGCYDFIVSDQFSVTLSHNGKLDCEIKCDDYHNKVRHIFDSIFKVDTNWQQCVAIQSLLFLSMLPLHQDKPDRQLAMLYVGLNQYGSNIRYGVTS